MSPPWISLPCMLPSTYMPGLSRAAPVLGLLTVMAMIGRPSSLVPTVSSVVSCG